MYDSKGMDLHHFTRFCQLHHSVPNLKSVESLFEVPLKVPSWNNWALAPMNVQSIKEGTFVSFHVVSFTRR
jgi:hypothetical protein